MLSLPDEMVWCFLGSKLAVNVATYFISYICRQPLGGSDVMTRYVTLLKERTSEITQNSAGNEVNQLHCTITVSGAAS
jgi:hypothetical protein